jgi:membrane protein required for colicin V production
MNLLDYAIVAMVVFGAVYGVSRGVLRMATSAASFVLGVYLASRYHGPVAEVIQAQLFAAHPTMNPIVSEVLAYIAVFAFVFAGVELAGSYVIQILHVVHLGWADRLSGAVVGAAVASVFAGLGILLMTALLPPDAPILRHSRAAPQVLAYNQALLDYVPSEVRDAYQVRRQELIRYWSEEKAAAEKAVSSATRAK